jgi:hypothetical protein
VARLACRCVGERAPSYTVYGYSFILTDLDGSAAGVEHHHRERARIEERIKDQKLGVSLRRCRCPIWTPTAVSRTAPRWR